MIFLKEIQFDSAHKGWAINLPAFKGLHSMKINKNVVFFVGENGSGKSTLIETLAFLCNYNVFGGSNNNTKNISDGGNLNKNLKLLWAKKQTVVFSYEQKVFLIMLRIWMTYIKK